MHGSCYGFLDFIHFEINSEFEESLLLNTDVHVVTTAKSTAGYSLNHQEHVETSISNLVWCHLFHKLGTYMRLAISKFIRKHIQISPIINTGFIQ